MGLVYHSLIIETGDLISEWFCLPSTGQLAVDMARGPQMKQLLGVKPIKELQKTAQRVEGAILKVRVTSRLLK